MADINSSLPIRTEADGDIVAGVVNASNTQINPATEDGNLASIAADTANIPALGQATSANSTPVVIASDQSDVPTNVTKLGGTAIATGAGNSSAGTQRVVIASDQGTIPVNVVSASPEVTLNTYSAAIAVGAGASSTQTYTTTGAFKLGLVEASASGKLQIEVKAGPSGSEVTIGMGFNSTANPMIAMDFRGFPVASGDRVLVIRTNRDNQAQDLYSRVNGFND